MLNWMNFHLNTKWRFPARRTRPLWDRLSTSQPSSRSRRRTWGPGCPGDSGWTPGDPPGCHTRQCPGEQLTILYETKLSSIYLIKYWNCPAEDGKCVNGNTVLAGSVGVQDTILEDKPAPLPLGGVGRLARPPPEVARHGAALAVGGELQPLRHEPSHGPGDVPPLEPGAQVYVISVNWKYIAL